MRNNIQSFAQCPATMARNFMLCLIYISFAICDTHGHLMVNNFNNDRSLDDKILTEAPLYSFHAKKFDCVSKCGQDERCLLVSYNAGERGCRLYEDGTGVSTGDIGWTSWRAASCSDPPAITNGTAASSFERSGSATTYSCHLGYTFQGLNAEALCTEDGTWDGPDGTCQLTDCGAPTPEPNSQAAFTDTTYSSIVPFRCNLGYYFSGSSQQATCDENGQWVGFSGSCNPVDCGTPTPEPNSLSALTDTTYLSTVTFTCDPGYLFMGTSQQATCDENGQWVGFSGSCDVVTDCLDIQDLIPTAASGAYSILPTVGSGAISVYCDMTDNGGGWTIIQRRTDGSENFYRGWSDYKTGFGTIANEYWLGNTNIWRLTTQRGYELLVDLEDWEGDKRYAFYSVFKIDDEGGAYKLDIGDYVGNGGDSLSYDDDSKFSTHDADNDDNLFGNCASTFSGAWWYRNCGFSNLNGEYNNTWLGKGVVWDAFKGPLYSLKYTAMKIRPY